MNITNRIKHHRSEVVFGAEMSGIPHLLPANVASYSESGVNMNTGWSEAPCSCTEMDDDEFFTKHGSDLNKYRTRPASNPFPLFL